MSVTTGTEQEMFAPYDGGCVHITRIVFYAIRTCHAGFAFRTFG